MKKMWLAALTLFVCCLVPEAGETKKDLDLMQGNWVVESTIERGKKPPDEEIKVLEVQIAKDTMTVKEKGKVVAEFQLKLDPAKKPKTVDLVHTLDKQKGTTDIGIYEVSADTLRFCIDEESKERPKEFVSTDKTTFSLIVLKRKK